MSAASLNIAAGAVSQSATVAQTDRKNRFSVDQWEDKLAQIQVPKDIHYYNLIIVGLILNKIVMNYLIVEGYKTAALKFQKETGIQAEMDEELIDSRMEIKRLIEKGLIQDAIAHINSINSEILDEDIELQFELKRQHLVELIKAKQVEEALTFAQAHLALAFIRTGPPTSSTSVLQDQKLAGYFKEELEKTMTLLIYEDLSAQPLPEKLQEIVDLDARKKLAAKVNKAILTKMGLPSDLKLAFYWQMLQHTQNQLNTGENPYEVPKLRDPMGDLEI